MALEVRRDLVFTSVEETRFGPIYHWDSSEWVANGDQTKRLIGNLGILVDRVTGQVTQITSSPTLEEGLREYEAKLRAQ